jgi:hypothetical protein
MEFETTVSFFFFVSRSAVTAKPSLPFPRVPGPPSHTAQDDYGAQGPKSGRIKTNIGAVYVPKLAQPLIVTGQTHPGGYPALSMSTSVSSATHTTTAHDDFTGYEAPTGIKFEWEGESNAVGGGKVTAVVEKPLSIEVGQGGLIEKVRWRSLFFLS